MSTFTAEELDLFRQWFNALQDLHAGYLEPKDYDLADRIADLTGTPRPRRQEPRP